MCEIKLRMRSTLVFKPVVDKSGRPLLNPVNQDNKMIYRFLFLDPLLVAQILSVADLEVAPRTHASFVDTNS